MKKLIAMLVMFTLFISNGTALAVNSPSLDFLKQSAIARDVEQSGMLEVTLNEPFGLLELLAEESKELSNHVDIVMLIESLFDSTMYVHSKTKTENNATKRLSETHIKSDVVFKANDNMEGNLKTNYSFWSEFDFSDEENPYFDIIMTHPLAAKYITFGSEVFTQNTQAAPEEFSEFFKAMFSPENILNQNDAVIESMERNALVTGGSKNVRISFADMGLKTFLADAISLALDGADESIIPQPDTDAIKGVLSTVPFFGNEALVMEYTLDSKGRISAEKTVLNVNLNIYDLMLALGEEAPPAESGITREMCKLNFTVESQTNFKYDSVKIEKPALDEKNSVDIFEYEDPYYYEYEYDDEYYDEQYYDDYYSPWFYADVDQNCFSQGELKYAGLRSFFESMGYAVSYDNGIIYAKTDSEYVKYKGLCFTVGSDIVYTDIADVGLYVPIFSKDGMTYISVADCEFLGGVTKDAVTYYFSDKYGYIEFVDNEYLQDGGYEY